MGVILVFCMLVGIVSYPILKKIYLRKYKSQPIEKIADMSKCSAFIVTVYSIPCFFVAGMLSMFPIMGQSAIAQFFSFLLVFFIVFIFGSGLLIFILSIINRLTFKAVRKTDNNKLKLTDNDSNTLNE